ncbi:tastin isoform X2 [Dermochelys coriacea]|uniref:tastin isoform X2 n=1 Tax=Dermochelys coriacea TaxID=27794 RepID=UPI0018E8DC0D|nr:tastin isoform X2 [Dermochelys coriacea]XP_038234400.1 tastin isoform X2 [Dermochelys coriacea]
MAQVGKSPEWASFAHPSRGKWKGSCSLDRSEPQPGKENKPSAWDRSDMQSRSKIPVLSKSRLPPDFQQLHQAWESQFQKGKAAGKKPCPQTCPFNLTCKGDKFHIDTAAATEPPAGSPDPLSRSQPRGALEEIQLGAAAQKTTPGTSIPSGKEVGSVEFVADPVALASILSNVGLANSTLGVARKPSLAQRVPLRGSRGNPVHASRSARTVCGSLYVASRTPALCPDPARTSCFSRLAAKDAARRATLDPAQHGGLLLKSQQIQALSATLRDLGSCAQPAGHPALQRLGKGAKEACRGRPHLIATAMQSEPAKSQETGGTNDQSSNGRPGSLSDGKGGKAGTRGQSAAHSSSPSRTDPMGASETEEFVPDLDALASVLSNVGLSHAALGPTGKLSLARRVPVKGLRCVLPSTQGSPTGSRTSLLRPQISIPPKGDFGRASCYSTLGLKGAEAPDGLQAAQLAGTPRTREISRSSPFGSARRVPVTQPQSLRGTCFSTRRLAVFSRTPRTGGALDKRPAQGVLQTRARWAGGLSPEPRSPDPDESALSLEKIVVRLFGDGESQASVEASVRKALTRPGEGGSKTQCIEFLARLLRKEVEGAGGSSSLDELQSLLAACTPSPRHPRTPPPLPAAGGRLKQLPSPSSCQGPASRTMPPACSAAFPAAGTTLTFSSQRPVCSHPLIRSLRSPTASGGAAGARAAPATPPSCVALVKQRLRDLLSAPQRFQEACLDDECAFYMSRPLGSRPPAPRCCMDPVAMLLEAQETTHFIPIVQLAPGGPPGEARSSLQAALPLQPLR